MSGCPCEADEIMAATKASKSTSSKTADSGIVTQLESVLAQMSAAVEGGEFNATNRDCLVKLDTVIKYIKPRWEGA